MPNDRAREIRAQDFCIKHDFIAAGPMRMAEFAASEVSAATKELGQRDVVKDNHAHAELVRVGCGVDSQGVLVNYRAERAESLVLESQLQLVDANRRLAEAIAAKRDEAMRCFRLTEQVRALREQVLRNANGIERALNEGQDAPELLFNIKDALLCSIELFDAALSQVPAEDKQNEG